MLAMDKDLRVNVRINQSISIRDVVSRWVTIRHSCGRSISGETRHVEEAHRQHLLNCKA